MFSSHPITGPISAAAIAAGLIAAATIGAGYPVWAMTSGTNTPNV